jgi:UDP-GlcNAc:undecaprenyl-phosphate GlcNAc-1-phosphate transferase
VLAVALAGSLAGFLLYNWHPACIFLGDSGALLIGLLIGVIGVEGSMEGPSAISILFPILAMGLPISDTAMAIFRRWVRNLPFTAADRRHVHHLLIGLGLNPRQAALLLYSFSGFLCGAVMLGVALRNEYLTLILGISGCLVFLLVVTSRRDELANLRDDFQERLSRKRQEREAAKLAWEAIQRIELCTTPRAACEITDQVSRALGCDQVQIACEPEAPVAHSPVPGPARAFAGGETMSGPCAIFRLSGGRGLWITVSLGLAADISPAPDIVFRYLQRLCQALAERLMRFHSSAPAAGTAEAGAAAAVSRWDDKAREPAQSVPQGLGFGRPFFNRVMDHGAPGTAEDGRSTAPARGAADPVGRPTPGAHG